MSVCVFVPWGRSPPGRNLWEQTQQTADPDWQWSPTQSQARRLMPSPYVLSEFFVQLCSHLCGGFVDEGSHFPGKGRLGDVRRGRALPFATS